MKFGRLSVATGETVSPFVFRILLFYVFLEIRMKKEEKHSHKKGKRVF